MRLEVLVSTVNKNVKKLVKNMKIDSDAIIINQCDKNDYEEIINNNHLIKVYYFKERGVGLSRNSALMRATADIVLFADDDEVLEDNYERKIIQEFKKNKKADMIIFDINSIGSNRGIIKIDGRKRVRKYNCLKYGAVRVAVKLEKIRTKNINYSLLFGGGCRYGSGEDSIFIYECIRKKMKAYTSPIVICNVDFTNSSWFNGYNEKYYFDKGALFYQLHGRSALIFSYIYLLRHRNESNNLTYMQKIKLFKSGINEAKYGGVKNEK